MWPILLVLGAAGITAYLYEEKKKKAATPPTSQGNVALANPALYAQIRGSLEVDLLSGGTKPPASSSTDQIATFYTQAYLSMAELGPIIQNAYTNHYNLVAKVLEGRPAPTV